jgi:very-short-patch-repair endonuclease
MDNWTIGRDEIVREWGSCNRDKPENTPVSRMSSWECSVGHKWETRPYDRIRRSSGCPFCSHSRPSKEYNLAVCCPNLMAEWDVVKNSPVKPTDILPGSIRKFGWICKNGHKWEASVLNRARKGSGCPYCAGQRATPSNNLALLPDLMRQLHPYKNGDINPSRITRSSMKKLWWKCVNGHEWKASVNSREKGRGCSQCHRKFSRIEVRLWSEMSQVWGGVEWSAKVDGIEIDVYVPRWKIGIEMDGFHWHKDRTKQDEKKTENLHRLGIQLIHAREKPLPLLTDTDVGYCGSESEIRIVHRVMKRVSEVSGHNISKYLDENHFVADDLYAKRISELEFPRTSVLDTNPELQQEWNQEKNGSITLSNVSYRSNRRMWWKCVNGHEWEAVVADRTRFYGGCPTCRSNQKSERIAEKDKKRRNLSEETRQKFRLSMAEAQKHRWPDTIIMSKIRQSTPRSQRPSAQPNPVPPR